MAKKNDMLLLVLGGAGIWLVMRAKPGEAAPPPPEEEPPVEGALQSAIDPFGAGKVVLIGGENKVGSIAVIEARPATGYVFDHWEWDWGLRNTKNPISVSITRLATVIAHFKMI